MTEALLRRLCWIGATEPGRAAVEASLFAAADLLKQPSASADEHQVLRSVIVVPLPGPGGHPISADRIVAIHATLRGRFVAQHLMLGEFFPGCPKPGARSHAIRPLDSPAAFFVVRHMIEPDWRLLQDDPRLLAMHTAAVRRGVLPRSSWDSERG